jgi:hypothetical protein
MRLIASNGGAGAEDDKPGEQRTLLQASTVAG